MLAAICLYLISDRAATRAKTLDLRCTINRRYNILNMFGEKAFLLFNISFKFQYFNSIKLYKILLHVGFTIYWEVISYDALFVSV
jgi:hypothetical protein